MHWMMQRCVSHSVRSSNEERWLLVRCLLCKKSSIVLLMMILRNTRLAKLSKAFVGGSLLSLIQIYVTKWGVVIQLGFVVQNYVQNMLRFESKMSQNFAVYTRKPRSYASSKLRLTDLLTGVKCRATTVAKKVIGLPSVVLFRKLNW